MAASRRLPARPPRAGIPPEKSQLLNTACSSLVELPGMVKDDPQTVVARRQVLQRAHQQVEALVNLARNFFTRERMRVQAAANSMARGAPSSMRQMRPACARSPPERTKPE